MRNTDALVVWLQAEMQRRKLSYRELGKLGGCNWQNFQRVIQHTVDEFAADTEDAICRAFGITREELALIAQGKSADVKPCYTLDCEKAMALWRWLRYDEKRGAVLKAMGFDGSLPDPYAEKGAKNEGA